MFKFKKAISLMLAFVLTLGAVNVSAFSVEDESISEVVEYVDPNTSSKMRLEVTINDGSSNTKSRNPHNGRNVFMKVYEDGKFTKSIECDWATDTKINTYADGSKTVQRLSDIVSVESIEVPIEDIYAEMNNIYPTNSSAIIPYASAPDYVANEPMDVDEYTGLQGILPNANFNGLWNQMGYRTGYINQSTYGYLQRKTDGVISTFNANRINVQALETLDEAVAVASVAIQGFWFGVVAYVVQHLIEYLINDYNKAWVMDFYVARYQWSYQVRENSYTGKILYSTTRTKDYWVARNPNAAKKVHTYRGTAYDGGYLLSNLEMIAAALD